MRLPLHLLAPLFAVMISTMSAQDSGPLYQFDFKDGSLSNSGTVGGEAEENPVPAGQLPVQITQDAKGVWMAVFQPFPNGSSGPTLQLPDSAAQLSLKDQDGELTVSVWVMWNGPDKHPDNKQPIIWKQFDGSGAVWSLSVNEQGALRFDWRKEGGGGSNRVSEQTLSIGEWYQVGVIWKNADKGGIEFYFDGNPVKATVGFTGGGPLASSNEPIVVGANPAGHMPLNGSLHSLRLYDRALSSDEMASLATPAPIK